MSRCYNLTGQIRASQDGTVLVPVLVHAENGYKDVPGRKFSKNSETNEDEDGEETLVGGLL